MAEVSTKLDQAGKAQLKRLLHYSRKNVANAKTDQITKAFHFCILAHGKDLRASGEPFYTHPVEVATIVARELPLDSATIVAALLHDVVEDTDFTLEDIRAEYGEDVAIIVDGATKITDVFKSHEITQAESYRKLLLSMVNDVRVIMVKFADRLHNMRTLQFLSKARQERMARETLLIYAPFAHRFGLGSIKWELEDLAFKYLKREAYAEIRNTLNEKREEREKYIRRFSRPIRQRLKDLEIDFEVSGRAKHLYSIYNKMIKRGKSIDEIYDLFAVRIIIKSNNVHDCFVAYGIVSDIYTPVPERFKNYISMPKKNGYQSLHTTVIGPNGRKVEVQIRTQEMHEVAEKGVAAHFKYKESTNNTFVEDSELEEWASWVRDVFDNAGDEAPEQLIESFKLNLYQDEIYVFTPNGDLKILPRDATPVDFAYRIHTNIGHHCIGARVNGKIVPLDHKLQSGDQAEILTSKNQTPNREWERFVVTHKAKSHIRRHLNEQKRRSQQKGREMWERKKKKLKLHINNDELEKLVRQIKHDSAGEFFFALGSGVVDLDSQTQAILDIVNRKQTNTATSSVEQFKGFTEKARTGGAKGVNLKDTGSTILYSYARCCNPIPGDKIVGVVTVGMGIKIHRAGCSNVLALKDQLRARVVDVEWESIGTKNFLAAVQVRGDDRTSMLNDITTAITSIDDTNIRSVNIDSNHSHFEGVVTVYVADKQQLGKIIDKLKQVKGIVDVHRYVG